MSEAEAKATKQPDPTETLREMRDAYLAIWSKSLIETVNSESYSKASGAALNGILSVAAPMKEPVEQMMLKTLQQLNMPTSADFAVLAGRFTSIELLLDDLDAKMDRIEKLLIGAKTAPSEKPGPSTESAVRGAEVAQTKAVSPEAGEALDSVQKTAQGVEVDPAEAVSPKAEEAPGTVTKAEPRKQTALRAAGTSKRTTPAKPVRRTPRKGIR